MSQTRIAWFRRNLRLADNPAWRAACEAGGPVVPVYIHEPGSVGGASAWWLHHSLASLGAALTAAGSELRLYTGDPAEILPRIASAIEASQVCFPAGYTPLQRQADAALRDTNAMAADEKSFADYYLARPGTICTQSGGPYKVFTPFWKSCQQQGEPDRPLPAPGRVPAPDKDLLSRLDCAVPPTSLDDLGLLPEGVDWTAGLDDAWQPGEPNAARSLESFTEAVACYADRRDRPDRDGTSRLSPSLHFGELSARQVWHAINDHSQRTANASQGAEAFLRQLYWRDFSGHLLFHFPDLLSEPLREEFGRFPWRSDDEQLAAWQKGCTGYPLVDAGMRQLWQTGWMHNRVRMLVASFLVKNLMIPWQTGADWFLDTLVDADPANNAASWQWVAGSGTDAAPYFRIFNPVTQSRKFDPDGTYIRRWVNELREFPDNAIHEPWQEQDAADEAGYPSPIVDLKKTRERALAAYKQL